MDDKIIVSNKAALTKKYSAVGLAKIHKAVQDLIAADAKRDIKTSLVFLDQAAAMKKFKAKPVINPADARENKEAIDKIFKAVDLEYLMILGAPDVVPHQDLKNPMPKDGDPTAWGDLPYACDAPYSRDIAMFKGPTRVIGRLPDLQGGTEPSHLLALLKTAMTYKSSNAKEYGKYFGLSTQTWRKSTELSLFEIFGNADVLMVSPPKGPKHPKSVLAPRAHFINCHGASNDPGFYGEDKISQPPSLSSGSIKGLITPGTVASIECCYGAQLYDSFFYDQPLPICQHYLAQGAYGYFGSTTIAYGPADSNGAADFITQYFLLAVLEGASLGRAALVARQKFIQQTAELDPVDLKTLGQFNLLGDPSLHPAVLTAATRVPKGMDRGEVRRVERGARRAKLRAEGEMLEMTKPTASRQAANARKTSQVRLVLANIAREAGMGTKKEFTTFNVKVPRAARVRGAKASTVASRYHVAVFERNKDDMPVAAVAKEVDGRIVGYRIYMGK